MTARAVRIRRGEHGDSETIASLHIRQIHWGLLAQMGDEFVEAFYRALIRSRLGFCFVAERGGRPVGFASGVVDWRRFYREFLLQHVGLAVRVLVAGLRQGRWRRMLQTTRYATSGALPAAELVSVAVEPAAQGAGVASALVRCVLEEFAARGVGAVRVTAGGTNQAARRLYERAGFGLQSEMEIHPGEPAAVYVVSLEAAGVRVASAATGRGGGG
jgi:ribosomal protein S18 acetylase RimI-like enzyme